MASEQAHPPPPPDVIAIAFVVESSLTVAKEWLTIIMDYISPMLRRANDSNPAAKIRMGFVTYAAADTLPSPILCKRFFVEYQPVTKEMKDSPANLGIGSTNSGGTRGMAALEGLVAAIELFDTLHSIYPQLRPNTSHIFHIASASPDSSLHPQWNDSPLLDLVTWEDMPTELKKRSISYSTINLRHNLSRFPELHSAIAPGAPKEPWFPAKPLHSVLLAGFPMTPQKAAAKRSNDVHGTPDSKRPRLEPPASVDASPKAQTPNTPSNQPKPSPLLPPQIRAQPLASPASQSIVQQPVVQPPAPTSVQVPPQAPLGGHTFNGTNLANAVKQLEEQMKGLHFSMQEAKKTGNTSMVETLQQEFMKRRETHTKLKHALQAYQNSIQQQAAAQAAQAIQAQNQAQKQTSGQIQEVPMSIPETARPSGQSDLTRIDSQAVATFGHTRSASGSSAMPNATPPNRPPPIPNAALVAQMQKMVDQQQRVARAIHPPQQNLPVPPTMNLAAMKPPLPGPPQPLPQQQQTGGPSTDQHAPGNVPSTVWRGTLSFGGSDAVGNKKETVIWVVANTTNTAECRADTWPTAMTLMPTADPTPSLPDLQTWLKRHRPVLCTFTPQTHSIADPVSNETHFKSLISLLITKGIYAATAWTLPSGEQGKNILFFPVNATSLGAACFPMTGIPDMPRAPQSIANVLRVDINNPEIRARLSAMSPEQRESFLNHLKSHRERALQMQRQAGMAQGAGITNNNNNMGVNNNSGANNNGNSNSFMAINALNMAQQNQQQAQHTPQISQTTGVLPPANYGNAGMMNTMSLVQQQQAMMAAAAAAMSRPMGGGGPVMNAAAALRNPVPPNFNHEMMQSFIQRNPDGGVGMGPQ